MGNIELKTAFRDTHSALRSAFTALSALQDSLEGKGLEEWEEVEQIRKQIYSFHLQVQELRRFLCQKYDLFLPDWDS